MEQLHEILLNKAYTGATNLLSLESNLDYSNNYYSNPTNIAEKVVDYSNVRSFLSNEKNKKIVQSYFSFLTSSTITNSALSYPLSASQFQATAEFKAIYYDDDKLADSFNSFYNQIVLRGAQSINLDAYKNVITNQVLDTQKYEYIQQTVYNHNYFWITNSLGTAYSPTKMPFSGVTLDVYGGVRNTSGEERLIEKSIEDNYYINVFLVKNHSQESRQAFDVCDSVIYKNISQNIVFSQSLIDISRAEDFIRANVLSYDNSVIKQASIGTQLTNSVPEFQLREQLIEASGNSESNSLSSVTLIQCFVDPSFATNENEYWSDSGGG